MNKAESYCYVIKDHLKKKKARVCFYYSNQHPNPKKRIEVKRTGDLEMDLLTLSELVQSELNSRKTTSIIKENEIVSDGSQSVNIDKYFICVQ